MALDILPKIAHCVDIVAPEESRGQSAVRNLQQKSATMTKYHGKQCHCIIEFCPTCNREGGPIQRGIFLHQHRCIAGVILSGYVSCHLSYDVKITSSIVL